MKKVANFLSIEKQDDIYTISMTAELQDDVGTIGFVEFAAGDLVELEGTILELEASKTVMSISSPLAGRIVARNEAAALKPTLLNSEKADEHWLIKLTDVDQTVFDSFEDA